MHQGSDANWLSTNAGIENPQLMCGCGEVTELPLLLHARSQASAVSPRTTLALKACILGQPPGSGNNCAASLSLESPREREPPTLDYNEQIEREDYEDCMVLLLLTFPSAVQSPFLCLEGGHI